MSQSARWRSKAGAHARHRIPYGPAERSPSGGTSVIRPAGRMIEAGVANEGAHRRYSLRSAIALAAASFSALAARALVSAARRRSICAGSVIGFRARLGFVSASGNC
jgi:hypothetical protein